MKQTVNPAHLQGNQNGNTCKLRGCPVFSLCSDKGTPGNPEGVFFTYLIRFILIKYFENGPLEPGYPKGCRQYSNEMSVLQDSYQTYKINVLMLA